MEVKIKQGSEMIDATIEMVGGVMIVSPIVEKWKPMAGQWYYIPIICNAQFKAVKEDWCDDAMDVLYFNKGWVFRTEEACQRFCDKLNQAIEGIKP